MSYYLEITDLTRTITGVLMTHIDVKRDPSGEVVKPNITRHFHVTITDANGDVVNETGQEKTARYWPELQAFADKLLADMELVDTHFDSFRAQVVGVRYPAAQE